MKRLGWVAFGAGAALVLCVVACVVFTLWIGQTRIYFLQGSGTGTHRAEAVIAVFGDTQKGLASFHALAREARYQDIDLAIHTGDLVSRADVGHYDLALRWVEKAGLSVPVVLVPGNHDIKGGEGLFERRIGERQFAFPWGPVHIVVVDNSVGPPDEAAVEALLQQVRSLPILVFMHVPPIEAPATEYKPKPAYTGFLKMIRKYAVCYVFSGHAHGYSRVEHGGVVFIANGVGGDSESWQRGQKAHMTIVEASGESLNAREIAIDPVFSLRAEFEHLAIGHVGEILFRTTWGFPALLLLIVVLAIAFRKLRKKAPPVQHEPPKLRFTPAKVSEPPDITI